MPTPHSDVEVLLVANLPAPAVAMLEVQFLLLDGRDPADRTRLIALHGARLRVLATNAHDGASAELIASLPKLELISCFSAGLDGVDVEAAAARGIKVTGTSAALADDVADVAIAHCLMLFRRFAQGDHFVREGQWPNGAFPLGRAMQGRRLGVLGLGAIGLAIARRAEAMGQTIAYHSRSRRADVDYPYFDRLHALAAASDILVVSCPATPETYRIVDAAVLTALGPQGVVVNIARGAVIDEPALIKALQEGVIAGAGLDVFDNEPNIAPQLRAMDQVSLSPHIGSGTHETREAMGRLMVRNILDYLAAEDRP